MFRKSNAVEGPPPDGEAEEIRERGERWIRCVVGAGSEGGSKEVSIVPIDAIIVSLYSISESRHQQKEGENRRTGPIHNASNIPNPQKPPQSTNNLPTVHRSLPLTIASASSLAASGPPIIRGVCSSKCNK